MSEEHIAQTDTEITIRNRTLSLLDTLRRKVLSKAKECADAYAATELGKKLTESGSISVSFIPSWNPSIQVLVVGVKFGFPKSALSASNNMEIITSIMSGLCFPSASVIENDVRSDTGLPYHADGATDGNTDALKIHIFASAAYYDHFPVNSANQTGYDPELLMGIDSILGRKL